LQNNEAALIETMKLNTGTTNPSAWNNGGGDVTPEGRKNDTGDGARHRTTASAYSSSGGAGHGMASAGHRRSSMATWNRGAEEEDDPQPSDHVARPNLKTTYNPLKIGRAYIPL
jgi:hypothetical protein